MASNWNKTKEYIMKEGRDVSRDAGYEGQTVILLDQRIEGKDYSATIIMGNGKAGFIINELFELNKVDGEENTYERGEDVTDNENLHNKFYSSILTSANKKSTGNVTYRITDEIKLRRR